MLVKNLAGLALVSVMGLTLAGCNSTSQGAPDQITSSLGISLEYNKICQTDNARKLPRCNRAADYLRDADTSTAAYDTMVKGAGTSDLRVSAKSATDKSGQ